MSRSRPASNPLSFHKPTGQFYVTRGGKRVYLGAQETEAIERYYRLALGQSSAKEAPAHGDGLISLKELANRFVAAQQANWRALTTTKQSYLSWLARFLEDHPRLRAADFTVEMFAAWKISLRRRGYAARSINHYLGAVRAMFRFADDADLLERPPKLGRVKKERADAITDRMQFTYCADEVNRMVAKADIQVKLMILLALNCGFGPKDIQDLAWGDLDGERVTLARSKTGISQTFQLWPETLQALAELREHRRTLIARLAKRGRQRSDDGHVFMTKYWRPWNTDAVAEQFRKLCAKAGVPCHGFYRLRHSASTAMSLVASPHVQRRFMRHSQLQQQVTYTHTPDTEVDAAVMKAREKLLGKVTEGEGKNPGPEAAA